MITWFLCALSSILLILSFPDFNISILAWVSLVPLFFSINGKKPLTAFAVSYCAGVIFYLGTIYWLVHVTLPGMIGIVLYLGLYTALFGFFIRKPLTESSMLSLIAIPSLWVALEYGRAHFLSGFGWNLLAYSQAPNLMMIQTADIVGAYGVSFLIVLINTALFFAIKDIRRKKYTTLYPIVAIIALFLCAGYGTVRMNNIFIGERLKVAVVQGNIPQDKKWDPEFRRWILDTYDRLTLSAAREDPDLIIWPESSVPGFLLDEHDLFNGVANLAKKAGSPLVVGAPRLAIDGRDVYYNSTFFVGKDGTARDYYDKIHLVPFGEFIPAKGIFSFVEKFTKSTIGDFSPGREYAVYKFFIERRTNGGEGSRKLTKKVQFSTLICFEDIFPDIAREFVKHGANFLVNMTNDAWFGDTSAPYQHAESSIFRAVENRVNVVRAANTGLSCFIDQKGRITSAVESGGRRTFVEGYKVDNIVLANTITFYTKYGDLFAYLCIAVSLIYSIAFGLRINPTDSCPGSCRK